MIINFVKSAIGEWLQFLSSSFNYWKNKKYSFRGWDALRAEWNKHDYFCQSKLPFTLRKIFELNFSWPTVRVKNDFQLRRFKRDVWFGRPLSNTMYLLIVETLYSKSDAVSMNFTDFSRCENNLFVFCSESHIENFNKKSISSKLRLTWRIPVEI